MTEDKKVLNLNKKEADKLKNSENKKSIFETTKDGGLRTTSVKNIVLILKTDSNLKDLFRFNEFTREIDVVRDAKIETPLGLITITRGQYTDQAINSVELYIESSKKYGGVSFKNQVIDQAITNVAYMNSYNPVIDYMNEAYSKWDKKQRLDNLFCKLFRSRS
ncbi:hypothetical protein [Lactobacillus isalae]|uniref:hypothetical protein n=1 Tax=Lactobacillus isalae TaxID=2993455 RepID=UPI0024A963CB|nr:hypothetical protein [Lactobacillus isalae]